MKNALVIGGSSGIGLAIVSLLEGYETIYIVDKQAPMIDLELNFQFIPFDLTSPDYSIFSSFSQIQTLILTAGFGRLALFEDLSEDEIISSFAVNTVGTLRILKHFYSQIQNKEDFYCGVLVSISGMLSSPFFSIYGSTKAALTKFIESVNVELIMSGTSNRILNVSPGSIKGTSFYNGNNNLDLTLPLAKDILEKLYNKDDLFIPMYDDIYKDVLERYHEDFREFGKQSYEYKSKTSRQ